MVSGAPTTTTPTSVSTITSSTIRARTSREPTRTTTSDAPERAASQRAAMRVPFPDISAIEPSGFQITTSSRGAVPGDHLEGSVGPDPALDVAEEPSAVCGQRATVVALDHEVAVTERVPFRELHPRPPPTAGSRRP